MAKSTLVALFLLLLFISVPVFPQSNEIGIVVGGTLSPDPGATPSGITCTVTNPSCSGTLKPQSGLTYEGVIAHRILNLHLASFYLELPIAGTPNRDLNEQNVGKVGSYSSIFFTPSLKLKLSGPGVSPFLSVGGGFVHFSPSSSLGSSSNQGAFQAGAGFDISTPLPHISLRGEAREFFTGKPDFTPARHNIFVGGGVILGF